MIQARGSCAFLGKRKVGLRMATVLFRQFGHSFGAILFCAFLFSFFSIGLVAAAVATPNSSAEQWVRAQIDVGKEADLSTRFLKPADRELSASFLEQLLLDHSPTEKKRRRGVNIKYAVFTDEIDLKGAKVTYPITLENCRFDNRVNFTDSVFEKPISLSGSSFKAVDFINMKVAGSVFFVKAVFTGPVNFTLADIAGGFAAHKARFVDSEQGAKFDSMKVGHNAFFDEALFAGPANFAAVSIASQFGVHKAQFTYPDPKRGVIFSGMRVVGDVLFNETLFAGSFDSSFANIGGNFNVRKAQFPNTESTVKFNSIKVGGGVLLGETVFAGDVDFMGAVVANAFEARNAKFTKLGGEAIFDSMKVGRGAFFEAAEFAGSAEFPLANIVGPFRADYARFANTEKLVRFDLMKVEAFASFYKTVFAGPVSFGSANFHSILLSNVTWPQRKDFIRLQGMTYNQIEAGEESDSAEKILTLIDQSSFNEGVYATLEEYFRREGQPGHADDAFIAQKWRERRDVLRWYTFDYWWNWALYLLVAYGRRPEQAIAWNMLFIGVGFCVFRRPENMEVQKAEYASETYSPFWYSLGLFLPFVNLHAAEVWRPKNECTRARIYMRIHILLGWVLVPIGLLSLTGLMK